MISGNTYYDVKHIRVSEGGRVWSGEEYGVERSREWRGVGRGIYYYCTVYTFGWGRF